MAPWLIFEWKELKKIYRVFDDLAVGGSCHRFPTYPPIHCSSSLEEMKKRYIYHLSYYYSLVNTQKKLKNKHVQTLTLWNKWNVPVFKKELEGKMSLCRRMMSRSRLLFQVFVTSRPWSLKTSSSNREIPRYLLVETYLLGLLRKKCRAFVDEVPKGPWWSLLLCRILASWKHHQSVAGIRVFSSASRWSGLWLPMITPMSWLVKETINLI